MKTLSPRALADIEDAVALADRLFMYEADAALARAIALHVVSGMVLGLALGLWAASWVWEPRRGGQ